MGSSTVGGRFRDWRNCYGSDCMNLLNGSCRSEHGRWRREREIFDYSVDNPK
jgi:hypothetical protein